ncbi:hypothetical protein Hanom_Chr04g00348841 [Helianthus anomalus]
MEDSVQQMLDSDGSCILHNIKTGIWIAGTMKVLDARHLELFLNDGFVNESWEYELVGSHDIKRHVNNASGGILDIKHFKSPYTAGKCYFIVSYQLISSTNLVAFWSDIWVYRSV